MENKEDDNTAPLGSWRKMYFLVLVFLLVQIIVYYLITVANK